MARSTRIAVASMTALATSLGFAGGESASLLRCSCFELCAAAPGTRVLLPRPCLIAVDSPPLQTPSYLWGGLGPAPDASDTVGTVD